MSNNNNEQTSSPSNGVGGIVSMGNGPSRCNIHPEFETTNIDEWNKHCEETGHTESGVCACAGGCGKEIVYEDIPFQRVGPKGKGIELKCEDCMQKQDDLNRQVLQANRLKAGVINANSQKEEVQG